MLKIRLMRIGAKKRPFYRVVVVDERTKRTGGYIELLGTYNPLTEPKEIKLKQDRIDYWVKLGAKLSDGFLRIIGKAPQRPPRKPKKEKKKEEPAAAPLEATPTEESTQAEAEAPANTSDGGRAISEPVPSVVEGDSSEVSKSAEESEPQPETPSEPEKDA